MMKICLMALAFFGALQGFSQTNFSGTWKLENKEYITGPKYANGLPDVLTLNQSKDSLIIEMPGQNGVSRSAFPFSKSLTVKSATSGRSTVRSMAWDASKSVLTVTSVISMPNDAGKTDLTRTDVYTLTEGKLKIHRKSAENNSESWEVKGIYQKQ